MISNPPLNSLSRHMSLFFLGCALITRTFLPGLTVEMGENALILLFSCGAFLFMCVDLLYGQWSCKHFQFTVCVWLFLGIAFISALWAADPINAIYQSSMWFSDILVFFSLCYWCRQASIRALFVAALLACVSIEALYAVYQYFIGLPATRTFVDQNTGVLQQIGIAQSSLSLFMGKLQIDKVFGHFTLSNSLGGYFIMYIPLLFVAFCRKFKTANVDWLLLLLNLLVLYALMLSKSRGSIVALSAVIFLCLGYYVWHNLNDKRLLYLASLILLLAIGIVFVTLYTEYLNFIGRHSLSLVMRMGYWATSLQIWWHAPFFGVGIGSFKDYYYTYKTPWVEEVNKAHNFYLQWPSETGLIGVFVLLIFFWKLRDLLANPAVPEEKKLRAESDNSVWVLALAALVSFSLLLMLNQFFEVEVLLDFVAHGVKQTWATEKWQLLVSYAQNCVVPVATILWLVLFRYYLKIATHLLAPIALKTALLTFVIHNFLDIDYYVPTLSQNAWVLFALLVSQLNLPARCYSSTYATRLFALILTGILFIGISSLIPKLLTISNAKQQLPVLSHRLRNTPPLAQGQKIFRHYIELLEKASQLAPWDASLNEAHANLIMDQAIAQSQNGKKTHLHLQKLLANGIQYLQQTIHFRSHWSPGYFSQAQFYLEQAKIWRNLRRRDLMKSCLDHARRSAQLALRFYPYKPTVLAFAGKIAGYQNDKIQATFYYRQALYYDDLGWRLWVRLPETIRKATIAKIGKIVPE